MTNTEQVLKMFDLMEVQKGEDKARLFDWILKAMIWKQFSLPEIRC